jgi:hypothetical protein
MNEPTVKRAYKSSDAEMLTTASVIIAHAIENKAFLISKRSSWKDPFLPNIALTIDNGFKNILGISPLKDQKEATVALYAAVDAVKPQLAVFKTQVTVDFKESKRDKDILKNLGYGQYAKVQRGDQEALVELLTTFRKNMTPELKQEIADAGTDAAIIEEIISYADVVKDRNVKQEEKKGTKTTITADGINQLNAIYKQVIGVAKIAASFYAADKQKAALFSFSKNKAALNAKPSAKKAAKKTAPAL